MPYSPKIISGGQTGADRGGLEAARLLGLRTGGWAPHAYRTENGPDTSLRDDFGLFQTNEHGYLERTMRNVRESYATLLVGDLSGGTLATKQLCTNFAKPHLVIAYPSSRTLLQDAHVVRSWLRKHRPPILNVAGKRESAAKGIQDFTVSLLITTFGWTRAEERDFDEI